MTCLFCKIASKEMESLPLIETEELIAIPDINPQAPVHYLIIPKEHITTINDAKSEHEQLLGKMILAAQDVARIKKLSEDGYRLIFNVNEAGGQAIYHIHLHLLGGRQMQWPPG